MASRLAEIYRSEKSTGGGLSSAVGKRLKEKIDPRQMLDQSGLLVSMFPSLKSFNATRGKGVAEKVSSNVGGGIDNSVLNTLAATSSLTAKNTMSLPMMARDMNLMKLNIFKLVKLQGGSANTNKTDIFFKNAKDRETAYESTIGKIAGSKIGGILGVKQRRDGQSSSKALFVTGGTEGEDKESLISSLIPSLFKGAALPAMLTPILAALGPLLLAGTGLAILGGLVFAVMKIAKNKDSFEDPEGETARGIKQAETVGGLTGAKDEADRRKKLPEYERTKLEISDYEKNINQGEKLNEKQLESFARRGEESAKAVDEYKKANKIGQTVPAPTSLPISPAGAGRGSVNPTLVTPEAETVPSNVIRSGSGAPIGTGTPGVYVTSGESPSPVSSTTPTGPTPSPMSSTATSRGTSPKPVASNPSEGEKAVRAAASKYGITDETEINALLAQTSHESGNYRYLTELGGKSYFDKYEPGTSIGRELGNTQPGDGYKYRGRGYIQLTGRDNYQKFAQFSGIDVVNNPDLVASPALGAEAALFYWRTRVKPKVKDFSNVKQVTQLVNGGQNGFVDREQKFLALMASSSGQSTSSSLASIKPSVTSSSPSSGTAVASTSTSVADGKMAAMTPSGGNTNVTNKPTNVASNAPSSGGKASTAYDNELFQTLVGYQSMSA